MSAVALSRSAGLYGKLPCRGDFVTRRLPQPFISRWDAWLQQGLAATQAALGNGWLDVYLTSPLWRFALAPNVCGDSAYVGVLMPSVDKVGRYFPLTAAVALPTGTPLAAAFEIDAWYAAVEELLLAALGDAPPELEAMDERLARLVVPAPLEQRPVERLAPQLAAAAAIHADWPVGMPVNAAMALPLGAALGVHGGCSAWWTHGSERVAPCVLVAADLPEQESFVAMLNGDFHSRGWLSAARARVAPAAVRTRSAAMTDTGKTRRVNEDSFACRDDLGAFLVADGLGGHQAGDVASRMVASVLRELDAGGTLAERTDRLVRALRVVNGCLQALSAATRARAAAGSTVVALLVDGGAAVYVWAGDSRVYRWRDGALAQLSRDHTEGGDGTTGNRAVTRAVGGVPNLELDVERTDARPGDRFLLCSDGLYGELGAEALAQALALDDPARACAWLKEQALRGAANDNLTAVVVHVDGGRS